ncbi:MAG: 6-phosphofructokinase [Bacteroidales bacterium]|nr:6-phosphofructokinase [Bacteroidales bacterium]
MKTIKRIATLTSGGDAPGMNAAVRAVVRTALYHNLVPFGIYRGYEGLIDGDIRGLDNHSVARIIQRGGTFLQSARSERFRTDEGLMEACGNLKKHDIDALIVIGGDGTFRGAQALSEKCDVRMIGIPGTIDNDLYGTDFTIGYDTAINTVVEAVDKIRDTAGSHNRLFFIEVMGRDAGFIALRSGIATGAEAILIPETETHIDELIEKLQYNRRKSKTSGIIIVAEGDDAGGAYQIAQKVSEKFDGYSTRVTVLGHVQRGGAPSCMDRVLASELGFASITALLDHKHNVMIGKNNKKIVFTPFEKATKHHNKINHQLLNMARVLSM